MSQQTMPFQICYKALDGQVACGISIDLENTFNTVSHDILLEELHQYAVLLFYNNRSIVPNTLGAMMGAININKE